MSFRRSVAVASSTIGALAYDPGRKKLAIGFLKPKTDELQWYTYENVGSRLFSLLLNAESVGGFFMKKIKPHAAKYPYAKVLGGPIADQAEEARK